MKNITESHRVGILPYVLGALLGLSIGLILISGFIFLRSSRGTAGGAQPSSPNHAAVSASAPSLADSRRNAIVVTTEKVAPAVVSVTTTRTEIIRANPFASPFARDWFERYFGTYKKQYATLGSGVIISKDGYILTNEHVIHDAEKITVTLSSGEILNAKLIGSAAQYDLALLKIEDRDLPYAQLGDSDSLLVGEWAVAIGSPFGQLLNDTQPTVTVGVISAVDRDIKSDPQSGQIFVGMIQTDAAINPGNSGGPLVNSRGEVIGINTFIFSTSQGGGNLGMGFAIPVNRGKWILDELLTYGRVREVWTGLMVATISPELAVGLNLNKRRGLLVNRVEEGSPADKSGLKPGDLILGLNGKRVGNVREANRIIFGSRVGDVLTISIERKSRQREVKLTLEERPSNI
jgi:serine protease Do